MYTLQVIDKAEDFQARVPGLRMRYKYFLQAKAESVAYFLIVKSAFFNDLSPNYKIPGSKFRFENLRRDHSYEKSKNLKKRYLSHSKKLLKPNPKSV